MVPDSTTMIHSSWILALLMDLTLTTRWSYSWAKLFPSTFVWTLHAPLLFSLCLLLVTSDLKKQTDFWQVKTWVPVQDETFPNMCIFMFQFPGGTDNYLTISGSSHPFLSSSSEVGFVLEHTSGVTEIILLQGWSFCLSWCCFWSVISLILWNDRRSLSIYEDLEFFFKELMFSLGFSTCQISTCQPCLYVVFHET